MKRCETCGGSMEGRRSVARYCSDVCRARSKRGYAPVTTTAPPEPDSDELIPLEDVARELQRTLRSPLTPPTAKAALAREYRATLEEIERAKPPVKDEVDELFARRVQRTGA